jgi:hypothetical protein
LKLNIDSVGKATFEKNYVQIKEKHRDRLEQKKHAPVLKEWAKILLSIQSKVKEVEGGRLKSHSAYQFVENSLRTEELNELPAFATEIRVQIAHSIANIAAACIEKYRDINSSFLLVTLALKIKLPNEDEKSLREFELLLTDALARERAYSYSPRKPKKRSWWGEAWDSIKMPPYF